MSNLSELTPRQSGVIKGINCQKAMKRRLVDMGLIPGTRVTLCKLAPMGDPMEISLRGYNLVLRKEDACLIEIDDIKEEGNV